MHRISYKRKLLSITTIIIICIMMLCMTSIATAFAEIESDAPIEIKETQTLSALTLDDLSTNTIISSEEAEGVSQLEDLIPDKNLRTEIWRSMNLAAQLGDPNDPQYEGLSGNDLLKAVLGNFTGQIYASGYEKEVAFTFTLLYKTTEAGATQTATGTYPARQEAEEQLLIMSNIFTSFGWIVDKENSKIEQSVTITDKKKPDDQLIKDITGIEYLRKAERIDLSYNAITSLLPLDSEGLYQKHSEDPAFANAFVEGPEEGLYLARKCFGNDTYNTSFTFVGNPILTFPKYLPGRLTISPLFNEKPIEFQFPQIIIAKSLTSKFPISSILEIPKITIGNTLMPLNKQDIKIANNTLGITENNLELNSRSINQNTELKDINNLMITGILSSGAIGIGIGTIDNGSGGLSNSVIRWASINDNGVLHTSSSGATIFLHQSVRVLYEVFSQEPTVIADVTLNKKETGTDNPVANAKYRLYEMKQNSETLIYEEGDEVLVSDDGQVINQDKDVIASLFKSTTIPTEYTTDENGSLTLQGDLKPGTYCFIESKSPDGYDLNTKPIIFTISKPVAINVEGGTRLTQATLSSIPSGTTYELYIKDPQSNQWSSYNNVEGLSYSPDQDGTIRIDVLENGTYQLRSITNSTKVIEFTITNGNGIMSKANEGATIKTQTITYIDRYSEDVSIALPEPAQDQQLRSLQIDWYDKNNEIQTEVFKIGGTFSVGNTKYENASFEDVIKAATDFINLNKGTTEEIGKIQGQVTVTPTFSMTHALLAENTKTREPETPPVPVEEEIIPLPATGDKENKKIMFLCILAIAASVIFTLVVKKANQRN